MRQKPRDGAEAPEPEDRPVSVLRVAKINVSAGDLATSDGKGRDRWPASDRKLA